MGYLHTSPLQVCEPAFASGWEFIGMGAQEDYFEWLGMPCGKRVRMQIWQNVPEDQYRQLVQSGDVGLSLMISPHPSLPPLVWPARPGPLWCIAPPGVFRRAVLKNPHFFFVKDSPQGQPPRTTNR